MKDFRIPLTVALLALALAIAAPRALAGGWAVGTLDALPERVVAGEPFTLTFTMRQHGIHVTDWGEVPLTFTHAASKRVVTVFATGRGGRYTTEVTLPLSGEWEWILGDGLPQPMPALTVGDTGGAAAGDSAPKTFPVLSALGLGAAAIGLAALLRTRRAWAGAVLLGAVTLTLAGFALPAATAQPQPAIAATTPAGRGQALFLAKGCVMCHSHAAVSELRNKTLGGFNSFSTGPDLSTVTAAPDYLRTWLKDPAAIKPETYMPNLELKEAEIEALIVFLNSE